MKKDNKENYSSYKIYKNRISFGNGVYVVALPTGGGKSTGIQFLLTEDINKLIFCISNNKKNIKQMYESHKDWYGEGFEKVSLFLKSKEDTMLDVLNDKEKRKSIENILHSYKDYKDINEKNSKNFDIFMNKLLTDEKTKNVFKLIRDIFCVEKRLILKKEEDLKNDIESSDDLSEGSGEDNYFIKKYEQISMKCGRVIKIHFKNEKDSLIKDIMYDKRFEWLLALFPQLNLIGIEYGYSPIKVIYLNISKFINKASMLFPGYSIFRLYELKIVDNSVVFIDEVDYCYNIIKQQFIEESVNAGDIDRIKDVVYLLLLILNLELTPREASPGLIKSFKELQEDIKENVIKQYDGELKSTFFMEDEEKNQKFLFFSEGNENSYVDINDNNRMKFYYDDSVSKTNGYIMYFEENKKDISKRKANYVKLLLQTLDKYLNKIINWQIKQVDYLVKIADNNKKMRNINERELAITKSINLFASKNGEMQKYMKHAIYKKMRMKNKKQGNYLFEKAINNPLYYGTSYFYYENNDENVNTVIKGLKLQNTPEEFLTNLGSNSTVIPISATADITSRYGNFVYDKIHEWIGQKDFVGVNNYITDEEFKEVQKEYELKTDNYENIKLKTWIINADESEMLSYDYKADEYFSNLLDKEGPYKMIEAVGPGGSEAKALLKTLEQRKSDGRLRYDFRLKELKGMLYAFHNFINYGGESGLFLNTFSIKYKSEGTENGAIYYEAIKEIFDKITLVERPDLVDKISLFKAKSSKFDKTMTKIEKQYNEGNKVILLTTYKTANTGQDFSINIGDDIDKSRYIKPNNNGIYSKDKVDFNCIFLGKITHLGTRLADIYNASSIKDRNKNILDYGYNLEKAYNLEEINPSLKMTKIKEMFDISSINENPSKVGCYETGKEEQVLSMVKQSIGRITRNSNKEKSILVMSMADNINPYFLEKLTYKTVIPKELEQLYKTPVDKMMINGEEYEIN